ncbi:hypothetical protein N7447_007742 [Penicillium robsamsonii]|uniref:uncharacterized protein n=1 Tax=Penicillium robsamsonii TaxID=1792511 RepID=UPI00254847C5|nr:uncharacterized protein N7447_007742 [Penicillium robsamsonii]KAJ5817734.1 hypothetical protein N7447_007742 [Penicillium robsamsonii]
MAPSVSLTTFLLHCSAFIGERLDAAPFQTFLILASIWMLSIPTSVFLMTRYWPFNFKNGKPRLRCRSCRSTDVAETPAGASIPTSSEKGIRD